MADGLTTQTTLATIPDASKIATDDAGAAGHVQMVKLAIATDGSATALTADNTDGLLVNLGANNDVTVAGVSTAAKQDLLLAELQLKADLTETQPVSLAVVPSHAVTNAGTFAVQESGAALTALQLIDDAVYASDAALNKTVGIGAVFDDVASVAITENQAGYLRMSSRRALLVEGVASGTAVTVSGTVTATPTGTQDVNQTQVNGAAVATSNGVVGTGVQRVAIASDNTAFTVNVGTFPDNEPFNVAQMNGVAVTMGNGISGTGVQRVTLASDSTGVLATVSTVTAVTTLTGSGIAHDGIDSGNPHKLGAKAVASTEAVTLVAANDRTDLYADVDGVLVVKSSCTNDDVVSERVTNTDGASTAFTNFAAVASTHNCVSAISIANTSAVAITVDFRDGTAGAVLWTMMAPAGGGSIISCGNQPYLFRTSQNTALAFDGSAAATTLSISISGYQSKS